MSTETWICPTCKTFHLIPQDAVAVQWPNQCCIQNRLEAVSEQREREEDDSEGDTFWREEGSE